jgi:hypothetical protein
MARGARPLFLERGSYRKRRMMDALKLLAFLGIILWMIPTLWPGDATPDAEPMPMSNALFYVFGVWLFLIGLAAVFVLRQGQSAKRADEADAGR